MNAKQEWLDEIANNSKEVECAHIHLHQYKIDLNVEIILQKGFTEEEYNKFIDKLDFEYDSGYGTQELHGTVWLSNGEWAERGEYDGSEWWQVMSRPDIPERLIKQ